MTTIYYFCEAGEVIDTDTQWYQVTIGTTVQASRDKEFLQDYSQARQCYFEPRNEESSNFVCKVAESIFPSSDVEAILSLKMAKCSARDLVRTLKHQLSSSEQRLPGRNRHRSLSSLSLNYRTFFAMSRK